MEMTVLSCCFQILRFAPTQGTVVGRKYSTDPDDYPHRFEFLQAPARWVGFHPEDWNRAIMTYCLFIGRRVQGTKKYAVLPATTPKGPLGVVHYLPHNATGAIVTAADGEDIAQNTVARQAILYDRSAAYMRQLRKMNKQAGDGAGGKRVRVRGGRLVSARTALLTRLERGAELKRQLTASGGDPDGAEPPPLCEATYSAAIEWLWERVGRP